MAETNTDKLFNSKVLPIMNKVMNDLRSKQVAELQKHINSPAYLMAAAAGPDGGMAAQQASIDSLRYNGKWNSKHTEDYIQMVKDELKKQKIAVTPEIEKKMIDKMIKDQIPKSSIDYILKKAVSNTLFYIPEALHKSPLENHITEQAEKRYNPSKLEKGTAYALGATADFFSTGGFLTGGWTTAAKFIGVDVALNAAMDTMTDDKDNDVPLVIDPKYREQYKKNQAAKEAQNKKQEAPSPTQTETKTETKAEQVDTSAAAPVETPTQTPEPQQPEQTNTNGWNGLLTSFGLNGLSDIGSNLGYVLAMLPDMLIGALTGRTKSLGLKNNLMPIASIVAGMFVKNPLMKMVLIGMGAVNLVNKAGHEALDMRKAEGQNQGASYPIRGNYKVYQDEPLNNRIVQPQIKGNCLLATIDKVPCTIALPSKVIDAYNQGALPLNTLANAILAKNDQMRQVASENYAANEQQSQTRTLAQR